MTDPISSFVSILGLLSIFKQERKAKEDQNREVFFRWLDEHRHQELKEFILRSSELPSEIDRALHEDTQVIIGKLEQIDTILASLLSNVESLSGIAHAVHPNAQVSDQALDILRLLVESGAQEFGKFGYGEQIILPLTNGSGSIKVDDYRFLEDDLNTLTALGFLLYRQNSDGSQEFYGITRSAVKYVQATKR